MSQNLSICHAYKNLVTRQRSTVLREDQAVLSPSSQTMNPSFERAAASCQLQVASPRIKNRQRTVLRSDATRPGSWFFVRNSVMLNLFQHLDPKITFTLKNKNSLIANENLVTRQRSSVLRREDRFLVVPSWNQILGQVRDDCRPNRFFTISEALPISSF